MTERNDILQRILNLRARGVDPASSENEAMACMERADRLMHSYRVEEAELALAEASGAIKIEIVVKTAGRLETGNGGSWKRRGNVHSARECSGAIARYCGVKVVFLANGRLAEFLGDRPDVELAIFLQDLIKEAMDRSYVQWRREYGAATGYGAKKAFQLAMARRINQRLYDMYLANKEEEKQTLNEAAKQLSVDPTVVSSMISEGAMPELTSTAPGPDSRFGRTGPCCERGIQ